MNPSAGPSRWRSTRRSANVIRHAYHNCADGLIELECRESADGLEITILDNGDAPDRSKICAREIGCDQPGGLGTHIIRDVMDTVSYEDIAGRETGLWPPSS